MILSLPHTVFKWHYIFDLAKSCPTIVLYVAGMHSEEQHDDFNRNRKQLKSSTQHECTRLFNDYGCYRTWIAPRDQLTNGAIVSFVTCKVSRQIHVD